MFCLTEGNRFVVCLQGVDFLLTTTKRKTLCQSKMPNYATSNRVQHGQTTGTGFYMQRRQRLLPECFALTIGRPRCRNPLLLVIYKTDLFFYDRNNEYLR